MKHFINCFVITLQLLLLSGFSYATHKVHNAGAPAIPGRGLYQEALTARYSNNILTLENPVTGWLHDMKESDLARLRDFNLHNLEGLSSALSEGIRGGRKFGNHIEISLEYSAPDGTPLKQKLSVANIHACNTSMQYILTGQPELPGLLTNVTLLVKVWSIAKPNLAAEYDDGDCCHCNAACQIKWIIFGICKTCVAPDIFLCDKFCP